MFHIKSGFSFKNIEHTLYVSSYRQMNLDFLFWIDL